MSFLESGMMGMGMPMYDGRAGYAMGGAKRHDHKTVAELKHECKSKGLHGYSTLRKHQLIALLRKHAKGGYALGGYALGGMVMGGKRRKPRAKHARVKRVAKHRKLAMF